MLYCFIMCRIKIKFSYLILSYQYYNIYNTENKSLITPAVGTIAQTDSKFGISQNNYEECRYW
jgi:hypothetical protein